MLCWGTLFYNANRVDKQTSDDETVDNGIYIGEGPVNDKLKSYDNMERFFDQVVMGKANIQRVVAIGPFHIKAASRVNFTDYSKDARYGEFDVIYPSAALRLIITTLYNWKFTKKVDEGISATKIIEVLHLMII